MEWSGVSVNSMGIELRLRILLVRDFADSKNSRFINHSVYDLSIYLFCCKSKDFDKKKGI
jgi:hypothetical protein